MLRITLPFAMAMLTLILIGCDGNPLASDTTQSTSTAPTKAHYHYLYSADTLYSGYWDHNDTLTLSHDSTWTSATVYAYQDTIKMSIASMSFKTPYKTSTKAAYWDGTTVNLFASRLPKAWDKLVVRFTNKVEAQ